MSPSGGWPVAHQNHGKHGNHGKHCICAIAKGMTWYPRKHFSALELIIIWRPFWGTTCWFCFFIFCDQPTQSDKNFVCGVSSSPCHVLPFLRIYESYQVNLFGFGGPPTPHVKQQIHKQLQLLITSFHDLGYKYFKTQRCQPKQQMHPGRPCHVVLLWYLNIENCHIGGHGSTQMGCHSSALNIHLHNVTATC